MISRFIATVDSLSRAFAVIAALLLVAAMLVVCQLIFVRYVFRSPTIWHTDFVVYSATAAMFLGAPYVLLTKGHVGVDALEAHITASTRDRLQMIGSFFGLAFCLAMFVAAFIFAHEAYEKGWETPGVWKIPQWLPIAPLALGFGLTSLQYVSELLKLVRGRS
jgi:TRAP-type C4-dicarboxylate transport system permease small subunit